MIEKNDVARVFKALCDENRVAIIDYLTKGEKCACNITEDLDIAQSKLSYHMKILCESGIVECWNVGKWTHYKISDKGVSYAIELLNKLTRKEEIIGNN